MTMKKLLAASLLLALIAAPASAAITYTGTLYDIVVSDPTSVGSVEGLLSYTVSAVAKPGTAPATTITSIGTLDTLTVGVIGAPIGNYTDGILHNEQFTQSSPPFGRLVTPDMVGAGSSSVDTHFLVDPSKVIAVQPLSEPEVDPASSGEPGDYSPVGVTGFGDYLLGAYAYTGGNEPNETSHAFLQVVIPSGTTAYGYIQVAGAGKAEDFEGFAIPEPATMSLLGLGGLAALIRRRK
jgi:hypothetical protein